VYSEGIRYDGIQPQGIARRPAPTGTNRPFAPAANGFETLLQQEINQETAQPLTFSGHALMRMQQRQINLSLAEMQALTSAAGKARQKGAKETLIIAERAAFVVSVQNNTVITVLDKENLKDNVFTQIDSAVVI